MKALLCLITLLSLSSCSSAPSKRKVDKLANQTLKEWEIPGLSLAIVHKGKEVQVAGYGVKKRDSKEPVDADTLFQICSLTKAFTGLTVDMLVREGKLSFEKPIRSYLPTFSLKDSYAQEQMTLRDLLTHRTGLPGLSHEGWRLEWHTHRSTEDLICCAANLAI